MPEERDDGNSLIAEAAEQIEAALEPVTPAEDPAQRRLRDALGQYATGVTIATTLDRSGNPVGMTVNSFSSVSLEPPLILWSIAETSLGFDVFRDTEHFCINVLCSDQVDLAKQFAQVSEDKFSGLRLSQGLHGIPKIEGCLAHFECSTEARYPGGDHIILLGRVARHGKFEGEPLLFHAGQFYDLSPAGTRRQRQE